MARNLSFPFWCWPEFSAIADSHLSAKYFSQITTLHFLYPKTAATTIYVPPIIFDRNADYVSPLVRVADIFWAGAGLSGHYSNSPICPPTSVYSLSLFLVDHVGGWDADESAIGEDLHMYIKCFFKLSGNLTTRSIPCPASHSNVHSNGKGVRGYFQDIFGRYRQATRHMWGVLDSGYALKSGFNIFWTQKLVIFFFSLVFNWQFVSVPTGQMSLSSFTAYLKPTSSLSTSPSTSLGVVSTRFSRPVLKSLAYYVIY